MLAFLLLCVVAWTCYAIREWSKDGPSAPSARPSPRGQLDLVQLPALPDDPSDEDPYYGTPDDDGPNDLDDDDDTDPDGPALRATWYDSRSCWGCAKGCKASRFKPYGGNIGAEVRGACAARARVSMDLPYHAGFAPSERHAQVGRELSTSVASLWSDLCQRCGEWMRSGGSVVKSTVAVDASIPF